MPKGKSIKEITIALSYPHPTPPAPGTATEVAPGILWARLPLPFSLDHVNVYFIEDGDGWAIVDCGISNLETRSAWDALLNGPVKKQRITRVIVTHHHPDHIGMAGWLCDRLGVEMWCGRETFLYTMNLAQAPALLGDSLYRDFYTDHGMQPDVAELVATRGHEYLRMISPPPLTFRRLAPGKDLVIGERRFQVLSGGGHCPEQIMLYSADDKVFLAADQVIEKISSNVSVLSFEPMEDPLGEFFASLAEIKRIIPGDALVLSGHRLPFFGLHERCDALIAHHQDRCEIIMEACGVEPRSCNDILPLMFRPELTPHEISFAFTEALAHMNHLVESGQLVWNKGADASLKAVSTQ